MCCFGCMFSSPIYLSPVYLVYICVYYFAFVVFFFFFFFKQKTAYEMRISDWSSYVCSSDLQLTHAGYAVPSRKAGLRRRSLPAPARTACCFRSLRFFSSDSDLVHGAGEGGSLQRPDCRPAAASSSATACAAASPSLPVSWPRSQRVPTCLDSSAWKRKYPASRGSIRPPPHSTMVSATTLIACGFLFPLFSILPPSAGKRKEPASRGLISPHPDRTIVSATAMIACCFLFPIMSILSIFLPNATSLRCDAMREIRCGEAFQPI